MITVNGYRTFVIPHAGDIVSARVIVNAGSAIEEDDSHGTAHFLEHMFFKGTTKRGYKEVNKLSSALGDINAWTDFDATAYTFSFLKDNFKPAIELLMEMVFHPSFPENEFDKEKGVILEECQTYLDDPSSYAYYECKKHLLGNQHGHPIIGTMESIKDTTLTKIKKFVNKHYAPNNVIFVIAGKVDEGTVGNVLAACVPTTDKQGAVPDIKVKLNLEDYAFHHKSKQAVLQIICEGESAEENIKENFVPRFFHAGFGGGMHSLLFDRIREELGLCYNVGSRGDRWKNFGFNRINCFLDQKNIDQATTEIMDVIKKVKEEGFTAELFDVSKKQCLYRWASGMQTSEGAACQYDKYFVNKDKVVSWEEFYSGINKVTNGDVIEYANKIFAGKIKMVKMTEYIC
jgi:predicted Zn-dependent peptidase